MKMSEEEFSLLWGTCEWSDVIDNLRVQVAEQQAKISSIKSALPDDLTEAKDWAFSDDPVQRIEWLKSIRLNYRAEIERLVEAVADHVTVRAEQYAEIYELGCSNDNAEHLITELTSQRDEAMKDADRLNFIQETGSTIHLVRTPNSPYFLFVVGGLSITTNLHVREAIDAARGETK